MLWPKLHDCYQKLAKVLSPLLEGILLSLYSVYFHRIMTKNCLAIPQTIFHCYFEPYSYGMWRIRSYSMIYLVMLMKCSVWTGAPVESKLPVVVEIGTLKCIANNVYIVCMCDLYSFPRWRRWYLSPCLICNA